ncbi:MAG: hypothetical protein NTU76_01210 [Candidatus Taylorbacteria bacterium]|nr:hypothetical protein [Candidatus Taylorbacteria bacterium]
MKKLFVLGGLIFLSIFGFAIFNSQKQNDSNTTASIVPTIKQEISKSPLPQETDIIHTFFNLVDTGKPSEAVMMMTQNIISNESIKQSWGVQLNAVKSVKVSKIEESSRTDWSETKHQYMVTLDIVMDSNSANNPIPYYGFEKGENIRFINLIKEGNQWKIEGIATGP